MAEYLKNNAKKFFSLGERLLNEDEYNLAIFNLEQALQLGLKYIIYQLTGDFPKIHNVVKLTSIVAELTNNQELKSILNQENIVLDLLEDAYISSRYLPTEFSKDTAEKAYNVVKRILKVLGVV
jgi:HEPN domain-containing protein